MADTLRFVAYVPGGAKFLHDDCGCKFCLSHLEIADDNAECPECSKFVTIPEGV